MHIDKPPAVLRFLVGSASLAILVAGIHLAASVITPLLIALLFAIVFAPCYQWLLHHRIAPWQALLVISGSWVVLGTLLFLAFVLFARQFFARLPLYQRLLTERMQSFNTWFRTTFHYQGPVSDPQWSHIAIAQIGSWLTVALSLGPGIILLTLLFLMEIPPLLHRLQGAMGSDQSVAERWREISQNISTYMRIYSISGIMTGLALFLWFAIWRIDFAVLWGGGAMLLNFLPYFGAFAAAVPAIILAWLQYGVGTALLVTIGVMSIVLFAGHLSTNREASRRLHISLAAATLSLILWTAILGPTGAIIGVPLTTILQIIVQRHEETQWLAAMLAAEWPVAPSPHAPEREVRDETGP